MEANEKKKVTITRKIQIYPNYANKEAFNDAYKTLWRWQNIVYKSANMVSTHLFIQEQAKEIFYFTDETKVKLANITKDDNGILSTSKTNTTYQVLSKMFKGDIPTAILTALNSQITSTFSKEKSHYFKGERSIRNYRKTIPIPFPSASIRNCVKGEKKDYTFSLFNLEFKTFFGKDLSGNEMIFDRAMMGEEYKLCDSNIQIKGKDIYLLAVFQFDKQILDLDAENVAEATLGLEHPIIVTIGKKTFHIGDKEEFLYRRLAIQRGLRRAQIASTYNKGGKGRHKKTGAIDKFKSAEISYVTSRIHKYSAKLVDLCIKYKAGKILLANIENVKEETKENEFLLRNWSYFGLNEKIKYKAGKYNIVLEAGKKAETAEA